MKKPGAGVSTNESEVLKFHHSDSTTHAEAHTFIYSFEPPDLAVCALAAQLEDHALKPEPPIEAPIVSTNTRKAEVAYVIKEITGANGTGKTRKGHNGMWWLLPCTDDGDPRWVCSLKGDLCTSWRK